MKNLKKVLAMLLAVAMLLSVLPMISMAEVSDKQTLYTVSNAHLDTIWNWSYETTISQYIPKTFNNNFALFEKYPDYKFNFEGARRYDLMEEYYPEAFAKVADYVEKGNWNTAGSAWENGDQNGPSPENHIRNVLYGNQYFADKFGNDKRSRDIFLPDCFGFGAAMPSYMAHCNLISFSTQKLTWGNTFPGERLPFDVGSWTGPDGNTVMAAIQTGNYTWNLGNEAKNGLRNFTWATNKATENGNKYGWNATVFYHGTGDTGGSPADASVRTVNDAFQTNAQNDIQVIFSTTDQWAREMTDAQKKSLPNWAGEFLLREHGVGSYTARAMGHRWNSRNELLAVAAEKSAVAAEWLGTENYPLAKFTEAWKRVIGHTFHDDITGTSLNSEYLRSWNEYMVSLNQFGNEYESAVSGVSSVMNTSSVKGAALVVNNPVGAARNDNVTASVDMGEAVEFVRVYDAAGNEVPSQIISKNGTVVEIIFKASVPAMGYKVYDVRKADSACDMATGLSVTKSSLSNEKYNVTIDKNGDISSIFDKELNKELLASPIRLGLLNDTETQWPSWELNFSDYAFKAPKEYVEDKARSITVEENGPARVAVRVKRAYKSSTYDQLISLEAGGKTVEVENVFNWYEQRTMLKAVFNTTAANTNATYDLGLGAIERPNNTSYQAEVPAQKWADVTDASGEFGVSILSDSKNGWDKPSDDTLRLTLIHTPSGSYGDDHGQDYLEFGENRFSFAVYGHAGKFGDDETQKQAQFFTEPMTAFQTVAHEGGLGSEYSFASVSNEDIIVRAIKKGETGTGLENKGDEIVVRFNEGSNKSAKDVEFTIGNGITSVRPIYGSEESIPEDQLASLSAYKLVDGKLVFDMKPYEIRTFAIKLADSTVKGEKAASASVTLPYNVDAISSNAKKDDSTLTSKKIAFPAELIPETITTAGVDFAINKSADGENNMVLANGQTVTLPEGSYNKLYVLAASLGGDKAATFKIGDAEKKIEIADFSENIAIWDIHDKTLDVNGYVKKLDLGYMATHRHVNGEDGIAKSTYLFVYEFDIPAGVTTVTLPADEDILIASATVKNVKYDGQFVTELYDQRDKEPSVGDHNEYFFGFEDDEIKALENTKSSQGGVSNVSYKSGTTSEDAHTGKNSFKVAATRTATSGKFYAYTAVQNINIRIQEDTYVEYWVKVMDENAKHIGLDLIASGSEPLRDFPDQLAKAVTDTNGVLMHPEYHAEAVKTVGEWTKFRCNIGEWMEGIALTQINFSFDMGSAVPAEGEHVGYIDDIYIGNGKPESELDTIGFYTAYMIAKKLGGVSAYLPSSIVRYNEAMANAVALITSEEEITQQQIDDATAAIVYAYHNMELKPTFTNFSSFEHSDPEANKDQGAKNGGVKSLEFESGVTSEDAHTGKNSFKLSVTKSGDNTGYYAYASIYTPSLKVTSDTYLEYWAKATDDVSKYINIDAYIDNQNPPPLRDFQNNGYVTDTYGVRVHPGHHGGGDKVKVGEWVKYRVDLGKWLNGRTISELVFAFDYSTVTGTHTAYIDDIYFGTEKGINLVPINALIKAAESLNRAGYTAESLAAMDPVLAEAKAEVANEAKTQDSIDAAKAKLSDAYKALEEIEILYNIVGVAELNPVTTAFGTAFENIALPKTVEVTLDNEETEELNVNWSSEGYVADVAGAYTLTGDIVTTPEIGNPEDIKASVVVNVSENTVSDLISIADIEAVTVANNSAKTAEGLGLPATVNVTSALGTYPAAITWDVDSCDYEPKTFAEQSFTVNGVVELPENVTNNNNVSLDVTVEVTVGAAEVSLTTDAEYYKPGDVVTFTAEVPDYIVKVGLVNELDKYLGVISRVPSASAKAGYTTWTITTTVSTVGAREFGLGVFFEDGSNLITDASASIIISKILPDSNEAATALRARVPESVVADEVFTITVKTTKSATNIGIFNADTNSALGKISQSYVDNDDVRTWTITMKMSTKGTRNLTIKAADINGAWGEGINAKVVVYKK